MKKFLVYLVVILVAVSVGFTVFYLVRDNETISISTSSIYLREGDVVDDLGIVYDNKKSFSDYEVISSNEGIAKYNKENGTLTAVSGGIATITFRTSNVNFRNLSCQVYVGDGSLTSPYYIQTADQLREIGKVTGEGENATVKYGLDKCYKLVSNINVAEGYTGTGYWIPIGTGNSAEGFTGNFDGNGYTISNININREAYISQVDALEGFVEEIQNFRTYKDYGLFGMVGTNGRVVNLKVDNVNVSGAADYANIGGIAGRNVGGTIERCEVLSIYTNTTNEKYVGGVVGALEAKESTITVLDANNNETTEKVRYFPRVDRCSANIVLGASKDYAGEGEAAGVTYIAGGIVGQNYGGIVIYSYSKGKIYISNKNKDNTIGGIVGANEYFSFGETTETYSQKDYGAHVKDCYSMIEFEQKGNIENNDWIGGVIGRFNDKYTIDMESNTLEGLDKADTISKVMGNYYDKEKANAVKEGETPTAIMGIARYYEDNSSTSDDFDKALVAEGKTTVELKTEATYLSHEQKEHVQNEDQSGYEILTTLVPWKFGTVWHFNESLNDGYPVLNLANIEVTDDLYDLSDGSVISTLAELQSMKLDGHYILNADITFGDNDVWVPIGTVNKPFVGSLRAATYIKNGTKSFYKIYNLKTVADVNATDYDREQYEYAGLFGVVSGANGGSIQNITMVNPTITNGRIVGAIVGSNGYNASGNSTKNYVGMAITNCDIVGGTITATVKAGGIAGENYGTITNCTLVDYRDNNFNRISSPKVTVYGTKLGYAGGIAGFNGAEISSCMVSENSAVIAETGTDIKFEVNVGGIAGRNDGNITKCVVNTSNEIAINNLRGSVGGVAGVNTGTISSVVVRTAINAPVNDSQVFAGGVVGSAISKTKVTGANINNTSIRGYNAGGLAGIVNYSEPNKNYNLHVDKNYNYSLSNAPDTFSLCAVDGTVAVEGKYAGGFAATIDNGVIRNCYTRASLRGIDSGSIKAGFAVDLNLTSKNVGLIINCYNTCSFAKENGKNYSVTVKEILQDPVFDFGMSALQRDAGYCFDYAYVKQDGVTNPTNKDALVNLFKKDPAGTSLDSLKGTAPKHLTNRNFSQDYWRFNDGGLPTLKACEGLEDSLMPVINSKYTLTFDDHLQIRVNGRDVQSGVTVETGDVIKIVQYLETERYSKTSVKINGVETDSGTSHVVKNQNINITYTEKFTHHDITFDVVSDVDGNTAELLNGKTYCKEGAEFAVKFVPITDYDAVEIIVKTVSGTVINSNSNSGIFPRYTMPTEAVVVKVTFKKTYVITAEATDVSNFAVEFNYYNSYENYRSGDAIPEGLKVKVNYINKTGYVVTGIIVTDSQGGNVEVFDNFYFNMPAGEVTVQVVYARRGTVTKPSNVELEIDNFKVEDLTNVLEGKTVSVIVTPEAGYTVNEIIVKTITDKLVTVTDGKFVMPDEDVVVSVTYNEQV